MGVAGEIPGSVKRMLIFYRFLTILVTCLFGRFFIEFLKKVLDKSKFPRYITQAARDLGSLQNKGAPK